MPLFCRRHGASLITMFSLLVHAPPLWAQAAAPAPPAAPAPLPNAGQLLQDLQRGPPIRPRSDADAAALPAPRAPDAAAAPAGAETTFTLRALRLSGNRQFSTGDLLPLLQDAIGQRLGLAGLQALADRITQHYRSAGYPVARAHLLAQDVVDGEVTITVLEGRLGRVELTGSAPVAPRALPLAGLQPGEVLTDAGLQRALLLASDLPGLRVRSTLQPGATVGTSDLLIEMTPGAPYSASLDADNHGGASTGRQRLGASLALNNPTGLADVASLRAQASAGGLLRYARLGWQLPVNTHGSRAGVAWSEMRYRLGGDFAALQAGGRASIASLYASHPLLRSRQANVNLQLQFDGKRLHDAVDSSSTVTDKRVQAIGLALNGDRYDDWAGGGATRLNAQWTLGRLTIQSSDARAVDEASARTQGHFDKLALNLTRQQALGPRASLSLAFTAQVARKNLDASEKLSLGGAGAVRAYASGEAPSDRAQLLAVDLRVMLAPEWSGLVLFDAAQGQANAAPWSQTTGSRSRHLSGAGAGLSWAPAALAAAQIQLVYASRFTAAASSASEGSRGRCWLQGSWAL